MNNFLKSKKGILSWVTINEYNEECTWWPTAVIGGNKIDAVEEVFGELLDGAGVRQPARDAGQHDIVVAAAGA